MPILGPSIGGLVGTIGGKLIGGVSGIALSKILEVYEKVKESKIKKMSVIPQLAHNLSTQSEIMCGLMAIAINSEEERKISNAIQETLASHSSSIYPLLEGFIHNNPNDTPEKCQVATQLTTDSFPDSNFYDYFILTPIPDNNAAEEFTSTTDLLVARWPKEIIKPWESDEEHVMNIENFSMDNECVEVSIY